MDSIVNNNLHTGKKETDKAVYLLKPRGFCAGVVRAIDIVDLALKVYGPPIYVRKEIVHNRHVVADLASRGAIFVDELDEVPERGRAVFSAHGVAPEVRQQAEQRCLRIIDATCPLVTKVHLEAVRFAETQGTILLIGHRDHDEVIGTMGEAPERTIVISSPEEAQQVEVPNPKNTYYLTQTTLSLDEANVIIEELQKRFPSIQGPPAKDICYATENRQQAVKRVAPRSDLLLVVGSENSSNSRRLVEVGENLGVPGFLVDDKSQLKASWFENVSRVAVTAGASAPEVLVLGILDHLRTFGFDKVEEVEVIEEDIIFPLPPELTDHKKELTQIANV
ncbi:MAG: 4-hydroxy-3-methylbut-2-enyl diphosphate reductase [Solibacterales bacterium]|nr:4-hydroxy-3-methylbut-2-enyl diphosphate reductase [Bryobacterales bacterium]|tara:strand:- start:6811 stop:7818 length:1008 start_codon:yes stop_codon:yes gene_type:complete